jgi:site-specific DNA-cytosine methylase
MKLFELFCGTKSVSKYAESIGIETVTLDYQGKFKPDYCMDILDVDEEWLEEFKRKHGPIDIIHASPDCRHYSKVRYNWKALGHPA